MSEGEISATRLWLVMMKAHGAIASFVEKTIGQKGLGMSDFMVLERLLHKGPQTMSEMAQNVLLANASTTSAVDRLERKDLVHRTVNGEDRRVRVVDLTAKGRTFIEDVFARHQADLDELMRDVPAAEKYELYRMLKKIGLTAAAHNQQNEQA